MSQFSHTPQAKKIIKPSFLHSAKMVLAKCGTRFNSKDVKQFPAAEFLLGLAMLQSEIVYENAHDGQMSCFKYHNVFSNSLMLISPWDCRQSGELSLKYQMMKEDILRRVLLTCCISHATCDVDGV